MDGTKNTISIFHETALKQTENSQGTRFARKRWLLCLYMYTEELSYHLYALYIMASPRATSLARSIYDESCCCKHNYTQMVT